MSAELSPERFQHAVRSHWAIGNSLHWVLDVTMNEDRQRNRTGNGPENLALLRRMALNVTRIEPGKDAMRGKLKRAGWDNNFLLDMIRSTKTHNPGPKRRSSAIALEPAAFGALFPAIEGRNVDRLGRASVQALQRAGASRTICLGGSTTCMKHPSANPLTGKRFRRSQPRPRARQY